MKKIHPFYAIEFEIRPHIFVIVARFKYAEEMEKAWAELQAAPTEHKERYQKRLTY